MMEKEKILDGLSTKEIGRIIYTFDIIDSTNSYGKLLSEKDSPHGTLIIAEEQTGGRGRLDRRWSSEKGKNLLFSVILRPVHAMQKISLLPFASALAVCDAVEESTQLAPVCKWPNDLLLNGKKFCGMLTEAIAQQSVVEKVVLGIGINLNQTVFDPVIVETTTSLLLETGDTVDRFRVLQKILEHLELRYRQLMNFDSRILLEEWKRKTTMFGKGITVTESGRAISATAIDVLVDGSLLIRCDTGEHRIVFAGDVTLSRTNN